MKLLSFSILCAVLCVTVQAAELTFSKPHEQLAFQMLQSALKQETAYDSEALKKLEILIKTIEKSPFLREVFDNDARIYGFATRSHKLPAPYDTFPCQPFQKGFRPDGGSDVNHLTPADIDVVGTIGDSLSAGTGIGARSVVDLLAQVRGKVFNIGGDDSFEDNNPTLLNMLRKYNPNIRGFSVGQSGYQDEKAGFNMAVPGDTSKAMLFQAETLVTRMRNQLGTENFKNAWKMVTIFLGNNDIAGYCKEKNKGVFTPENYALRLKATLDYLKANSPRTLVSVVSILDVHLVKDLNIGFVCSSLHHFMGKCAAYPTNVQEVININQQFQEITETTVNNGDYFSSGNFSVVVQPFFKDTNVPKTSDNKVDLSYFAPDCFHFSQKGHAAAAMALWNALFQAVGRKKDYWKVNENYECPNLASPYIKTNRN